MEELAAQEKIAQAALDRCVKNYGVDHNLTKASLRSVLDIQEQKGLLCIKKFTEKLAETENTYGLSHSYTADALSNLFAQLRLIVNLAT